MDHSRSDTTYDESYMTENEDLLELNEYILLILSRLLHRAKRKLLPLTQLERQKRDASRNIQHQEHQQQ